MIHHAGLIAAFMGGGWRGVLIEGPSGAGKSDLALRCLDQGFRLVADDRVELWACTGLLYGRAPETLAGRIEVRGLDVLPAPALAWSRICLSVRAGTPERIAEPALADYAGLKIPSVTLALLESSTPAKLSRALRHLGGGPEGAYLGGLAAGVSPQPGGDSR
ncbi:MAG: HPr kinase/phosphorylase [Phenylobacterium sp.]|uniref:HPr kinase/phosphorylase n=1 Tax=Phenylobacterium sp. TaxID=1871053 RepID=UPI001B62972B|nr:HPr kinase/phosphorylase [Phenylobacterium sp.]MBP7650555.1 HPr kinase/phosphorylase [Phenylobacterium sp.]MBP7817779.1 HPr kinase/phosphorylase [Phenylobacterium sp.]MBP9230400.1 HPr kinase/phosphorylase [Phenylobacterium sp.]MBP9754717.1 HPr kinase/phosphorylase [Phenylobacterium sp.]